MRRTLFLLLLVSLVAAGAGLARAQQGQPMATNAAEYKFVTRSHLPALPVRCPSAGQPSHRALDHLRKIRRGL